MRILVDARLGWGSGIGRYIANTIPRVAALRPRDQFVAQVLPADKARAAEAFAGVPNLDLRTTDVQPFSLREQYALAPLARSFDLTWFTNYWVPLNYPGRFLATVHDLLHLHAEYFPASAPKRLLSRRTFSKVARSAAAVSFGSRFSQREFEAHFGRPEHSAVHYYGIDHAEWPPFDPDNPPRKAKRLLAVGASKQHKNFDLLLDAWRRARVGEGWTLTVISPDEKLRTCINLQRITAGAGRTEVLHGVSNAELRRIYAETQVMLTPSLYEGFGLPFMEAMQAGAFGVTSTAESMVEIGQGAFAWYVNGRDLPGWTSAIEDACAMFDDDRFDFAPLQRRNMRHASRFNWQRVAEVTAGLIDQLA